MHGLASDAEMPRGLNGSHFLAVHHNSTADSAGRIVGLLLVGSPATVAWLVVSVAVDTINGEAVRWAHVSVEVLEFLPAIADLDPATAVIAPALDAGVGAPLDH